MLKTIRGFKGLNGVYKKQYQLYRTISNNGKEIITSSSIYPLFNRQDFKNFIATNKEVVLERKAKNVVVSKQDNDILYQILLRIGDPKNKMSENIDLGQILLDSEEYSQKNFMRRLFDLRKCLETLLRTGDITNFKRHYPQIDALTELSSFFEVVEDHQKEKEQLNELIANSPYILLHAPYALELYQGEEIGKNNEEVLQEVKKCLNIKKGLR